MLVDVTKRHKKTKDEERKREKENKSDDQCICEAPTAGKPKVVEAEKKDDSEANKNGNKAFLEILSLIQVLKNLWIAG